LADRGIPVVAIVGATNVGKSTLFNRLIAKRVAVVSPEPGVTRDRNFAIASWTDSQFWVIDTGGFLPRTSAGLEQEVTRQAEEAIQSADLVLLVGDASVGCTQTESEIARLLIESGKNTILVVNKVDNPGRQDLLFDFHRLGLEKVLPISALHGTGTGDLLDEITNLLGSVDIREEPEGIRLALLGRPNTGKSSLANHLIGEQRVIVDDKPGTTRDSIDTFVETDSGPFVIVDTAGLIKRSSTLQGVAYYSMTRALRSLVLCDVSCLLLDASEGIVKQDLRIAATIWEAYKPCLILFNKWDLVEKETGTAEKFEKELYRCFPFIVKPKVLFISALTGQRIQKVYAEAKSLYDESSQSIPTHSVNEAFERITARYSPWSRRGTVRVFYAVQTGVKPPTFTLFVNDPSRVEDNYARFLTRSLSEELGLMHVPLRVRFRRK
jgi:GTP-binding protein